MPGNLSSMEGPIQSSMVTPRISQHIPINEAHLVYINSNSDAIKGIKKTPVHAAGVMEKHLCS